jgi:preprotein translocase subunit SecY
MRLGLGRRGAFTVGALVVCVFGNGIPIPGIDLRLLGQLIGGSLSERHRGLVPGLVM